ncbi:MAG: hypothetical protein AAF192_16070 [Pseudomonadota bacterium]
MSVAEPAFAARAAADLPRHLWQAAAFSASLWLLFLLASLVDPREFLGAPVWAKPQKFAFAVALHFATIAWAAERLPAARAAPWLAVLGALAVISGVLELVYIGAKAGQGEASHFNEADAFHAAAYTLMGIGAVILVAIAFAVGWLAWRDRGALGPGLRLGVGLGFMGGALGTAGFGFALGGAEGHHFPEQMPDAATLPLIGWSAATGDLRPPHFLATHAMQILPAVGWAADRAGAGRGAAAATVWAATAALTAAAAWTAWMAFSGLPLIRL